MDDEYQISVLLNPHDWDDKDFPYSWCILRWTGRAWVNHTSGWAKSVKEGFDTAYEIAKDEGLIK